jgi:glycosyltransferase involved in cell wall biosynthesis
MTMKILHVSPTYIPAWRYGGPIRSVHGLCVGLARRGHEVHVFTTNVDGPCDSDVPLGEPVALDGVMVWYFPSRHLRRLYWSPEMAAALAERVRKFEVLHLHSLFNWPPWGAARAAHAAGVPYLVAPRGMLVKELVARKSSLLKTVWLSCIERKTLEQASGIHATSRLEIEDAGKFGYRFPPFYVVPNGVEAEELAPDRSEQSAQIRDLCSGPPFILFMGRVHWKKGLDRLIRALALLEGVSLVIAGNDEEGYRPGLEALARELGVQERIIHTGSVQGADKQALLSHARVLALPSYSENFGLVVIEAMAAGRPVVVTPEVGLAEMVRETGAGLVAGGDPEHLADALARILGDPEAAYLMGQCGRNTVREQFTWDVAACQMEHVYEEVLASRSRRGIVNSG